MMMLGVKSPSLALQRSSSEAIADSPELSCGIRLKLLSQEFAEIKAFLVSFSSLLGFSLLLLGALPCTLILSQGLLLENTTKTTGQTVLSKGLIIFQN